jgi:hypothetical protein
MRKKHWSILGLALGVLVLGVLVGLITVNTVAADPTPGVKIQIPRIDVGDVLGTGDWETWIQVQNVGTVDTGAIFLGWGDYSGVCPTNDPGVVAHYCALIRENALWTLKGQLDESVKSGIIYTVRKDLYTAACSAAEQTEHDTDAWRCWKKEWEFGTCEGKGGGWADPPGGQGEEVAVTVTRYGPNDYGTFVSSTYTGISEEMEGEDPPYNYYAPYIMKGYNGLDTEMTIQNSGQDCTSVWIDYMEQGTCYTIFKQHIEQLAPGEAVRVKVPCNVGEIPCYWLGSAHISAEMPLGIIVDQTSFDVPCGSVDRGTLLTYRARPKVEVRNGEPMEDTLVYADLIFREWSGWDASIQVQNLSRIGQRTFVTVDFMDNSGDEILFLADWVCPTGSKTFYLPPVYDLGFNYVGAAEIQSHNQVAFPGGEEIDAQPIFAVVDLKKADDPYTPQKDAQAGSYNAHPYSQKEWVDEIALPFMAKDTYDLDTSWTSLIAIRNNSNCNKIKPKIWFKDETGELLCELQIPWLHPKQVKLIDLDNVGCLYPGYVGAAKVIIEPEDVEQLCDKDNNGHADNEPILPSVIVVEKNVLAGAYGDITNIYEGIPYSTGDKLCDADLLGTVRDNNLMTLLNGVTVTVPDGWAEYDPVARKWVFEDAIGTTGPGGMYELENIVTFGTLEPDPGTCYNNVKAETEGFLCSYRDVCLHCGEDKVLDFGLICDTNTWYGTVKQWVITPENGAPPIKDATVTANWTAYPDTCDDGVTITATNAAGYFHFTQELPKDVDITLTISKAGYDVVTHTHKFEGPTCGETYFFTDTNHSTDPDWIALRCYAQVSGYVWNDDGDGVRQPGEPPLPGTLCTLYNYNATKILDYATSDANGICRFFVGEDAYGPDFDFDSGTLNDLQVGIGAVIKPVDDVKPCDVRVVNFPL